MRRDSLLILQAVHDLGTHVDARLDAMGIHLAAMSARLDRMSEQLAGLQVDLGTHHHDEG